MDINKYVDLEGLKVKDYIIDLMNVCLALNLVDLIVFQIERKSKLRKVKCI